MPTLVKRLRAAPIAGQFVRYAVVGVTNVIVYLAIFNGLLSLHWHRNAALAVAFIVTTIPSFLLNKLWAFKDPSTHWVVRQYLLFGALSAIGFALNQTVFTLVDIPMQHFGRLGHNVAALAPIPFSVLWNFYGYRRWTFKPAVS